ncbi:MAG: Ig-like domain-containing protein [Pseudomonadales bacterium]
MNALPSVRTIERCFQSCCLALVFLFSSSTANAGWFISEVFSNSDGSLQYIELLNATGQGISALNNATIEHNNGGTIYTFSATVESGLTTTAGSRVLLGTSSLFSQASVTQDLNIAANLVPRGDDMGTTTILTLKLGAEEAPFNYLGALPSDGVNSLTDDDNNGIVSTIATPTNNAGVNGSFGGGDPGGGDPGGGDPGGGDPGGGDPGGGAGGGDAQCSSNGTFNPLDSTCNCNAGFTGPTCATPDAGGGDPGGGGSGPQWFIKEIYSNNGVEFIELFNPGIDQTLVGSSVQAANNSGNSQIYVIPSTTPEGQSQLNKHFLIGTANVESAFGVTPDVALDASQAGNTNLTFPFLPGSGTVAGLGAAFAINAGINYSSLTLGTKSLNNDGSGNVSEAVPTPTNFAGACIASRVLTAGSCNTTVVASTVTLQVQSTGGTPGNSAAINVGDAVTVTATVNNAPIGELLLTLSTGQQITIADGQTSGNVNVALSESATISVTADATKNGGYQSLDTTATVQVTATGCPDGQVFLGGNCLAGGEDKRYAFNDRVGFIDLKPDVGGGALLLNQTSIVGYAFSERIGWIDFSCQNTGVCDAVNFGVSVGANGALNGFAFNELVGFISFSCQATNSCGQVDYGVNVDSTGTISGFAFNELVGFVDIRYALREAKTSCASGEVLSNFSCFTIPEGSVFSNGRVRTCPTGTVPNDNETVCVVVLVAVDDPNQSTNEDTPLDIPFLANDSFSVGTSITIESQTLSEGVSTTLSSGSSVVLNGNTLRYNPALNFNGTETISYTLSVAGVSKTATITVAVAAVNDAPVGNTLQRTITDLSPITIPISQLVSDPDVGDTITFATSSSGAFDALQQSNTVTFTPTFPIASPFAYVFDVRDQQVVGTNGTVTFTVPANDNLQLTVVDEEFVTSPSETVDVNVLYQTSVLSRISLKVNGEMLSSVIANAGAGSATLTLPVLTSPPSELPVVVEIQDLGSRTVSRTININYVALQAKPDAIELELRPDNTQRQFTNLQEQFLANDSLGSPAATIDRVIVLRGAGEVSLGDSGNVTLTLPADFDGGVTQIAYQLSNETQGTVLTTATVDVQLRGGPTITVPETVTLNATGRRTDVSKLIGVATAVDADNQPVAVSVIGAPESLRLEPGARTVTYKATDRFGATSTAKQTVNIVPVARLEEGLRYSEGGKASFTISLNGPPPTDVSFDYLVEPESGGVISPNARAGLATAKGTADSADYDLTEVGNVQFLPNGPTSQTISFNVTNDGVPEEDETVNIFLYPFTVVAGEAGPRLLDTTTLILTDAQLPPSDFVVAVQNAGGDSTTSFLEGETVTVQVTDAPENQSYTFTLLNSDGVAVSTVAETEPSTSFSQLAVGEYTVQATLTSLDNNLSASRTATFTIEQDNAQPVVATRGINNDALTVQLIPAAQLSSCLASDSLDDTDRDGIFNLQECNDKNQDGRLDFLQTVSVASFLSMEPKVISTDTGSAALTVAEERPVTVEANPGVRLKLGSLGRRSLDVKITPNSTPGDDGFTKPDNLFDFEAVLRQAGQKLTVVLPQNTPIPPNATYRKLIDNTWQAFVVDANNSVSSALAPFNTCPAPGSREYQVGLTTGHNCIQLVIQDGGPNDADGVANGTVVDPGGVAAPVVTGSPPQPQVDEVEIALGQSTVITPLDNDTDADGDTLTIINVSAQFGTVTTDGFVVNYTAADGFFGTDILIYQVSDGSSLVEQEITVNVFGNRPPLAVDDAASVLANQTLTIDPLANDTDADNDALELVSATVNSGTVTINSGRIEFVPSQAVVPTTVTITYVIQDATGATDTGEITVNVEATPRRSSGGGGAMGWMVLLLTGLLVYRRLVRTGAAS